MFECSPYLSSKYTALNRVFSYIRGRHGGCQHRGHLYAPYIYMPLYVCMPPVCLYAPYTLVHLYVLPIPYVPHMSWGNGGISVQAICLAVFEGHQNICQAFLCLSVHPYASQFISHTSCCPSLWVTSLLDWMPMDVCYTSCC